MAKTTYTPSPANIKVVGLGGAGCSAINRMVREEIKGVDFIAMNTDGQALALAEAPTRIQLGEKSTRGLGTGGDTKTGAKAAEESCSIIENVVQGADMVFVVAGMGGGTGTGAIPIVAAIAKQSGALTIAVVTKPFTFEGTHRAEVAEEGLVELSDKVDTLIIIPCDRLLQLIDAKTSVDNAFKVADNALCLAVQAVCEVVTTPGLINLDFADIGPVLRGAGPAWVSVGRGSGESRAAEAAKAALASPLLDVSVDGASGVLLNITGGPSLTLFECNEAANVISQAVDPDANIIFGVIFDPEMGDEIRVTIIATGFTTRVGRGIYSAEELRRLMRGSSDALEVPAFLRIARRYPIPKPKLAIDDAILEKGYSIFSSGFYRKKQSALLKKLRDEVVKTSPHHPAVELFNSLWRLSRDIALVPDHANVMIRLLRRQSSEYDTNPLYIFYSFVSSACDIRSASDFGRVPSEVARAITEVPLEVSDMIRIPTQVVRLSKMVESLSDQSFMKSHIDWLRQSEEILLELAASLKSEQQTPEVICLGYVVNQWLKLVAGGVQLSLSNLECCLAANKPLYVDRINEVQIAVSGGMPGQRLRIHAPVTPSYDVRLDNTSFIFQGSVTNIGLRITPHDTGPLNILIEIEGVTYQIEALASLENPFIVGRPVQSEHMFVGRQEIVSRIVRSMNAPQPTDFLIIGRRRIGKTSLLHAIKRQLPKSSLPVLISTETCGRSPIEVCQALAIAITRSIEETQSTQLKKQQVPAILQDDPVGSFISWLEITHTGLSSSSVDTIVLLVDEALDITEWDDKVQKLLRYILSSMMWIRGVLAGPPDIIEKMTEQISSPLYNIFTTLKLGPIDRNDTHKLIIVPLRNCGIDGAEDMLDTIYDYSGGIPYYIQAIGHELIENYFSRSLTGEKLLSESLAQIRVRLRTSYPVTLKKLSAEQKVSIVLVANGVNPPEVSARRLEQADLIEREDGKWIVRARIEKEWIREYADQLLDSAGEELWDDHKKEIDLLQLAEDLQKLKKEFAASEEVSETLTSAISAAKKKNGAKTLKYLGKVGQLVLDTATKIGADMAVAAIRHIYGLP